MHDGRGIFATTIHELAHAAHWRIGMTYTAYSTNVGQAGRLAESWATMVGWYITRDTYQAPLIQNGQFWQPWMEKDDEQLRALANMSGGNVISNDPWYTPLFVDLIDDYNQVVNGAGRPVDVVSGYQINYLQNVLIQRPTNWYMYRDHVQSNPPQNTIVNQAAGIQLFSDYD
jgi:hypothetical protein